MKVVKMQTKEEIRKREYLNKLQKELVSSRNYDHAFAFNLQFRFIGRLVMLRCSELFKLGSSYVR